MLFKGSVRLLVFIVFVLGALPSIVLAQSDDDNVQNQPVAFIDSDGNLNLMTLGSGEPIVIAENVNPTEIYPLFQFTGFVFSPDGSRLIYHDTVTRNLMMVKSGDEASTILVEGNTSGYLIAFDETGDNLYYMGFETTPTDSEFYVDYTIYQVGLDGGESTPVTTFTYEVGCGGGTNDPAEIVYTVANSAGFLGNNQYFARIDGGFLYTIQCGGIGMGIVNDAGESHILDEQLRRVQLSPDGSKLAGIREDSVIVYNLSDESILVEYEANADQLGWANDNTVVFSRLDECSTIEVSAEQAEALGQGSMMFESRFCEISVNTLDISTDEAIEFTKFNGSGYGVGSIQPVGDGGFIFTLVDSQYLMTDAKDSTAIYHLSTESDGGGKLIAGGVKAVVGDSAFVTR